MSKLNVFVKKINENANIPSYATEGSAGLDLYAAITEPVVIPRGEIRFIGTGIAISIQSNEYAAFLYARSGLACKKGICLANGVGVVDSDYRGEIKVALINLGQEDYTVSCGERIAQMVFMPVALASLTEAENLDDTMRGSGGFGSTGV